MQPKPIRETDEDYLKYIRGEPGLIEGDDIVAHHTVSVGAGGSDYLAVPLPFKHHTPGVHSMGKATFQKEYNINFDKEIIRLLINYIKKIKCNKANKKRATIENALSDAESWGPGEVIECKLNST